MESLFKQSFRFKALSSISEFCESFKNTFFAEHLRVTVSRFHWYFFSSLIVFLVFLVCLLNSVAWNFSISKIYASFVSRKSRSTIKKNRIMKFYFVIYIIGQLHGHVTLNMWKLSKKRLFSILKKHTRGGKTVFSCLFQRIFMVFWHQSTLCKGINQTTNSVNSDLPAFPSLCRVSYYRRENLSPENSGTRERKSALHNIT